MSYGIARMACVDGPVGCEKGPLYEIRITGAHTAHSGPYCYEHAARRCAQLNASASPPPGDDEYGLAKDYEQMADQLPPGWKL